MRGGGQKMKKDSGRLAPLFVGLEDRGGEVEGLGEEVSVGLDTLLVDQAACQGAVEEHHKQEEVVLTLGEDLAVPGVELVELDECA
jgi:hypothetical protein